MPKLIHVRDDIARALDVLRKRKNCSYSEAIDYLLSRSRTLTDLQRGGVREYDPDEAAERRERDARKHDSLREQGAAR